jgi:putative ABC transport system substrate-binding protein
VNADNIAAPEPGVNMRRRQFIALGAAAAWPFAAKAQQAKKRPLIGWLGGGTPTTGARSLEAFLRGLREYGYEDGKTIDIVYRWAEGDLVRFPALAKELTALSPDVIVSASSPGNIALMQSTASIPIVGALTIDPVKLGLAVSHNRPGRNFTGILVTIDGLPGKQAEVLLQLLPRADTLGVLMNPDSPPQSILFREIETALHATPVRVVQAVARTAPDLPAAFDKLKRDRVDGVVILADAMFFTEVAQIISLAAATQMPAIHGYREHVQRGGLVSYGVDIPQNFRRTGYFVDRILKGIKPGDLPIELPTKLELAINLKAAKALNLEIPSKFLFTADEVIE